MRNCRDPTRSDALAGGRDALPRVRFFGAQESSESLTFHGTGGEAGHDSVLEDHHKNDQRDRYDHGGCHN